MVHLGAAGRPPGAQAAAAAGARRHAGGGGLQALPCGLELLHAGPSLSRGWDAAGNRRAGVHDVQGPGGSDEAGYTSVQRCFLGQTSVGCTAANWQFEQLGSPVGQRRIRRPHGASDGHAAAAGLAQLMTDACACRASTLNAHRPPLECVSSWQGQRQLRSAVRPKHELGACVLGSARPGLLHIGARCEFTAVPPMKPRRTARPPPPAACV